MPFALLRPTRPAALRAVVPATFLATFLAAVLAAAPARAEPPRVVADIAPVHSLAALVMRGAGAPDLLLPPGASPHGHALRPSEAAALDAAEVVFHVGGGLTPWLHGALDRLAGDARVIELMDLPGTVRLDFRENALFEDEPAAQHGQDHDHDHAESHEEDHDHGHEDGHEGEGHAHEGLDPHGWLDPENGKLWLDAIAEALADLDPENAALYRRNAEAGKAEIDAAASRIEARLAPVRGARFVVFHDAYQYFERRFGLGVVGAILLGDAASPGPARLADLRGALRDQDIACVFAEPQFDPGLIDAVAEGSGARVAVLDPQGAALAPGAGFYVALLQTLAEDAAACLGGGS